MPQSTDPQKLAFLNKYLNKNIILECLNGKYIASGIFQALEYDRSITLKELELYVRIFDNNNDNLNKDIVNKVPTLEDHSGYCMAQRKNLLIPGSMVTRVLLAQTDEIN